MDADFVEKPMSRGNTNENDVRWASTSLTHVQYLEGDFFGKLLAYASLTPIGILVAFVALIAFRRDLHTITFFIGTILSELFNWILKHTIREPRPSRGKEVLFSEYGMPSSHSQFMWFFAAYFALFLLFRLHHCNNSTLLDNAWKYICIKIISLGAFTVSFSRVYLEYHTTKQVVCGAFVGIILAVIWFSLTQIYLTPLFPIVASWPISEFFMIKDMTLIPNVMWFEYTTNRTEARTRNRKLISMKSK